jgi:hypothetical protein
MPGLPERSPGAPANGGRAAAGMPDGARMLHGDQQLPTGSHLPVEDTASRYAVATIRVVVFRASHPARPPSRQRRLVHGFPGTA